MFDLAIIGGGPAGIAAGVYAARKKLKTIFLTHTFEGQSTVSDGIENWIGDIKISGADLSKKLETHLKAYASDSVVIQEGVKVTNVSGTQGNFSIQTDSNKTYAAKTVLITSGSSRRKLTIPGADRLEHKGLTYCASCDGPLFSDQHVAVIGGGNAGFESAAQLAAYCATVTILNRSEVFKADPVTIEKLSKNPKIKILTNAVPKEVYGEKFVDGLTYTDTKTNMDIKLDVTGIFVEIGAIPNTGMVKDIVALTPTGNIIVDPKNQRTSTPGIWAAGDCTDGLFHQNNIAAGDGVKALEDIYLAIHA